MFVICWRFWTKKPKKQHNADYGAANGLPNLTHRGCILNLLEIQNELHIFFSANIRFTPTVYTSNLLEVKDVDYKWCQPYSYMLLCIACTNIISIIIHILCAHLSIADILFIYLVFPHFFSPDSFTHLLLQTTWKQAECCAYTIHIYHKLCFTLFLWLANLFCSIFLVPSFHLFRNEFPFLLQILFICC